LAGPAHGRVKFVYNPVAPVFGREPGVVFWSWRGVPPLTQRDRAAADYPVQVINYNYLNIL